MAMFQQLSHIELLWIRWEHAGTIRSLVVVPSIAASGDITKSRDHLTPKDNSSINTRFALPSCQREESAYEHFVLR